MSGQCDSVQLKEEYELWRKNCRYMYDFVSETALTWPSLTVQWLPPSYGGTAETRLLLGTHTSGEDDNYLKLATTKLPQNTSNSSEQNLKASSAIKISKKIKSSSEINRARFMPQDPSVVAAINGNGECEIFNLDKGSKEHIFSHHQENGYGLSWNSYQKGLLLTASDDRTSVLTDINKLGKDDGLVQRYDCHSNIVNDAKWHAFESNIFGSVSDDENVYLFDTRCGKVPVQKFHNPGSHGINSMAFSPFSRHLLAIGNQNSNISFLDLRNLSSKTSHGGALHTMMGHGDGITSMEFSPHNDGILASGSQDRRVIIWDLSKIGEEQAQEDAEDGAPEIFMMHAGHTGSVTDLNWCPSREWTLASTADDNILHLWKVSDSLITEEVTNSSIPALE